MLNHTSAEKHISRMQITGSGAVTRAPVAGDARAALYLEKSATKCVSDEVDATDRLMHSSFGDVVCLYWDLNVRTNHAPLIVQNTQFPELCK